MGSPLRLCSNATLFVAFSFWTAHAFGQQPAGPAMTAPPANAPVVAPVAESDQCSRRWVEQIYPIVRKSVVRVHTVGGLGAGFLFGDDRHVVTAFHVVSLGRPLVVHLSDGGERSARAVAIDPAHDLALLELDAAAPFPPLSISTNRDKPDIGSEVLVIGHPLSGVTGPLPFRLDGLLNWSASRGIVSAKNETFIQTDASVNPGNSGGPMVDCAGHVLGVVSWKLVGSEVDNLSFAVRSELLNKLWTTGRNVYVGRWTGAGSLSLLSHIQSSQAAYLGVALGVGGNVFDRVDYMLRGGYLWGIDPDESTVVVDTRRRLMVELEVRGRLLLGRKRGLYLTFGGGASWFHDLYAARNFELGAPPATCATPPCQPQVIARSIRSSYGYFRPLATAAVVFGRSFELGYTMIVDAGELKDSIHQIGISLVSD